MCDINEHIVTQLITTDKVMAWSSVEFMLSGTYKSNRYLSNNSKFNKLLIASEIPRNELKLNSNKLPGDIDLLIIPCCKNEPLYKKTIALEIKIVKPTIIKPSKNANSLGQKQVLGLAHDGFPYVGLLHIVSPEALPEHLFTELPLLKEGPISESYDKFGNYRFTYKADLFPLFAADRHYGRLLKLALPNFIGTSSFGVSLKMHHGRLQVFSRSIQSNYSSPKLNPYKLESTIDLIKNHHIEYSSKYNSIFPYSSDDIKN